MTEWFEDINYPKVSRSFEEEHFSCRVYFPRQFHALREIMCKGGNDQFIQSLSRCKPWACTGGKSGSSFAITLDGNYILKFISHQELFMFCEYAYRYMGYMSEVCFNNHPSLLAEVLGCFKLKWSSQKTKWRSETIRYVMVHPNLFGQESIQSVFDLKGSLRNRFQKSVDKNVTLWDLNFIQDTQGIPLSLTDVSMEFFADALKRDTLFLQNEGIVDYSLLLGINTERNVVVVGIIDYCRKYTWDKKIESGVKSLGRVAGQERPTVLSPKDYAKRFLKAMDGYFMAQPDMEAMCRLEL